MEVRIEKVIKEIFSLPITDSFGYGVGKINVHDLEEWALNYGFTKEKILDLLVQ